MTTYGVSHITARELFATQENIAFLRSALRIPYAQRLTADMLTRWYDGYMIAHEVEPSKIEDVQVWADYMTNEFIKAWRGKYNVTAEQVPFLPYDLPTAECSEAEMPANWTMIKQRGPYGRFPKFTLPSAVEDGVAPDGSVVIHNEHQTVRIFQPITWPRAQTCDPDPYGDHSFCRCPAPGSRDTRMHPGGARPPAGGCSSAQGTNGWRFGKNNPGVMKRVAGYHGHLYDADDNGSLYDWEPLNRPHTKYPMGDFFSRQL
jgi:hypothetical protein